MVNGCFQSPQAVTSAMLILSREFPYCQSVIWHVLAGLGVTEMLADVIA